MNPSENSSYPERERILNALNPESIRVDERSLADRLSFASRFAELVNFYDKNNHRNGNWSGFLLKDPVILLAAIGKTDYSLQHALYYSLKQRLERLLSYPNPTAETGGNKDIAEVFDQLFDLIQSLFISINSWMVHMSADSASYQLKAFVYKMVSQKLAPALSQLLALRLLMSKRLSVTATDNAVFGNFQPEWEHPGSIAEPEEISYQSAFATIQRKYAEVFSIYVQVIDAAAQEFEKQSTETNEYPDTALLISFLKLMEVHQRQLNETTQKHLDFYYQDILRQNPNEAGMDEAFICCNLKQCVRELRLPAGTAFKAGSYPDKSPIMFELAKPCVVTGIAVNAVQTVSYKPVNGYETPEARSPRALSVNSIQEPSTIRRNSQGQIIGWDLFGGDSDTCARHGFAIATPALHLSGAKGIRRISVTFSFAGEVEPDLLDFSEVYLSTGTRWYQSDWDPVADQEFSDRQITRSITLSANEPGITAFKNNPDGFHCQWPMLKVLLGTHVDLSINRPLVKLDVSVEVEQLENLVLANDRGVLDNSKPFEPFGPVVNKGDGFYVGSQEMFAKSLTSFDLVLNWASLPENGFSKYYQQYNDYLRNEDREESFGNTSFHADVEVLEDSQWKSQPVSVEASEDGIPLFATDGDDLSPMTIISGLSLNRNAVSPELLHGKLMFNAKSPCGFLRIGLNSPEHGFGTSLYARVVAMVSLENALKISNSRKSNDALLGLFRGVLKLLKKLFRRNTSLLSGLKALPNTPYIPKLASFTVNYSAAVAVDLAETDEVEEPFEIYHYDTFTAYKVYDSGQPVDQLTPLSVTKSNKPYEACGAGVGLYPVVPSPGVLYFALSIVEVPCTLNLYFEISPQLEVDNRVEDAADVSFAFLSDTGWINLAMSHDSTHRLSSSGIVELALPENSAADSPLMPGGHYWIAVTSSNPSLNRSKVTYLNSQGLRVRRVPSQSLPPPDIPRLESGQIKSTVRKMAEIESIVQPYASFAGRAAEDDQSFHYRVSQRMGRKDRNSVLSDYEESIVSAYPGIFYARCQTDDSHPGLVKIGLVRGYDNADFSASYKPAVEECMRLSIQEHLSQRVSPSVRLDVFNLRHQPVLITARIRFTGSDSSASLCHKIAQRIKRYLSPWIKSDQPVVDLNTGLSRTQLINYIKQHPQVVEVESLEISTANPEDGPGKYEVASDEIVRPINKETILISAKEHGIRVAA